MADGLRQIGCNVCFAAVFDGALTRLLSKAGYKVSVLREGTSGPTRPAPRFFISYAFRYARDQWRLKKRLAAVIQDLQPDCVHIHSSVLLFLAGVAAKVGRLPAYWQLPNTVNRKLPLNLQAIIYQLYSRWCGIHPLGNSCHTARSLGNRFVDTRVLYLGVDTDYFSPLGNFTRIERGDIGISAGIPVFAIVARVVPEKAQDRIVEAALGLVEAGESLQLVIVGGPTDSDFFRTLRQKVASANADGVVKFVGAVSDPRPWYVMADIVINGRVDPEPFGLTVVEAMLMERPVIAYRAGGPGETIIDGETGWLIDDCSTDAYREGIRRALADKPRWGRMGRVAREHASSRFSVSCMVNRYVEYVEDDSRRGRRGDAKGASNACTRLPR